MLERAQSLGPAGGRVVTSPVCVRFVATVAVLGAACLVVPPAEAGHRLPGLCERSAISLKAGLYDPDAGRASEGFFGGIEYASRVTPLFELGIGADYFYRSRRDRDGLVEGDGPYDIPVEGEVSHFESSTHLGAFGGTARLRFPSKSFSPVPFFEGGLAAQILHLRAPIETEFGHERTQSDTFAGWGWHVGGGLEVPIGRQAALLGEVGWNHAEPTREEEIDGTVTTLRALASGTYGRLGVRFFQ
jgi:hypothetical protein